MRPYGWNPDLPDHRDFAYGAVHAPIEIVLPQRVSLRERMPPVFDQGDLGSCTANALCAAFGFIHPGFIGSRLELYYRERSLERDIKQDGGAQIRDGVKVLNKHGVAPEADWPYDVSKFAVKPPAVTTRDASQHKVASYSRLTTGDNFRTCLAAGFPFVIGFTVYESLESDVVAKTGIVPLPAKSEKVLGGHAVCVIGYDMSFDRAGPLRGKSVFLVQNSWGSDWGSPPEPGCFWVDAAYFENPNLADDAWTLRA